MNSISATSPYLTPQDFLDRKDQNSVAQYCSDDAQNPVPVANLPTDPTLVAGLATASGMLESAVLTSSHYAVSDLQSLAGVSLEYMKTILADIAMYEIATNRIANNVPQAVIDKYQLALQALQDLSDGKRIFAFDETAGAGTPEVQQITPYDRYFRDDMVTARMSRGFGQRYADRPFF